MAGGEVPEGAGRTRSGDEGAREGAAGAWRNAFLNAPYLRDVLVRAAVISETFETAITWDRFEKFHAEVMQATRDAVTRVCGSGSVACRFTHVYPDGPAPYYTVLAPGRRGSEIEQWARDQGGGERGADRPPAAPSPTTTPSGATTAPGTTASGRMLSRGRCAPPSASSTPPAC